MVHVCAIGGGSKTIKYSCCARVDINQVGLRIAGRMCVIDVERKACFLDG